MSEYYVIQHYFWLRKLYIKFEKLQNIDGNDLFDFKQFAVT